MICLTTCSLFLEKKWNSNLRRTKKGNETFYLRQGTINFYCGSESIEVWYLNNKLTADRRSAAAMSDLFPDWQPCK